MLWHSASNCKVSKCSQFLAFLSGTTGLILDSILYKSIDNVDRKDRLVKKVYIFVHDVSMHLFSAGTECTQINKGYSCTEHIFHRTRTSL